jgi:hypothetical protein
VLLGFRPGGGIAGVVAALALVVAFAFGLSWIFITIGLLMRAPNAVMNAGFVTIFPLTFLSNVFVEPDTLPGALEAFVRVNPVSILATATRDGGKRRGQRHRRGAGSRRGRDRPLRSADHPSLPQTLRTPRPLVAASGKFV